jgi:hypothetical protein
MYIIKLLFNFLVVFFLFNCARNRKIVNNVAVNNLSNYNYFNKNLYSRGSDNIYIDKFQGVGILYYPYVFIDFVKSFNEISFYRLKVLSYKN